MGSSIPAGIHWSVSLPFIYVLDLQTKQIIEISIEFSLLFSLPPEIDKM